MRTSLGVRKKACFDFSAYQDGEGSIQHTTSLIYRECKRFNFKKQHFKVEVFGL